MITIELMPWGLTDKYYRVYENNNPAGFVIVKDSGATYTCTDPTMLEHVQFNIEWAQAVKEFISKS